MPTLLLSPRHSEDTRILWRVAVRDGWQVHRVHNWQVPSVETDDLAIYGEPLLTRHIARQLGVKLEEPALDWFPNVPTIPKTSIHPSALQKSTSSPKNFSLQNK